MLLVEEMMTPVAHGLAEEDTLDKALAMMAKYGFHHIPVVKNKNELVGLVSHRDVLSALDSHLRPRSGGIEASDISMGHIMIKDVFTVGPQTSLRKAAIYIRTQRYGCLPVEQDGKLVGIITDSDFVNIAIDLLEQIEDAEPPELEEAAV
jgi:CBS domain-containing membrane protein